MEVNAVTKFCGDKNYKPILAPWLDASGHPLSDAKLKIISKIWDESTWDNYFTYFETPRIEFLIPTHEFDAVAEQQESSIFMQFDACYAHLKFNESHKTGGGNTPLCEIEDADNGEDIEQNIEFDQELFF